VAAEADTPPIDALLAAATASLAGLGEDARVEAERLLCHVLNRPRSYLYAHPERRPGAEACARYRALLARRRTGEPLAYLVGSQPFLDFTLRVTPATLIPRADTETLVDAALDCADPAGALRVLDLGTGSGAVALALARARADWMITATDLSETALAVAVLNARSMGLERIRFLAGDWLEALPPDERFDLIVSNPPYVAEDDEHLADPGLAAEPRMALVSGPDGLTDIRRIAGEARRRLADGGWLWLEHGWNQAAAVRDLLRRLGYHDILTRRDAGGRERVTGGRVPFHRASKEEP
jgi:release factor glutamine methyltransferase